MKAQPADPSSGIPKIGPAIRIEGARKLYRGGHLAVSDVSLLVDQGTVHGLLGSNGAGKTTTLKMLLGLVAPTEGTFEILGQPAGPAMSRRLGFLPEQPYFPPLLTASQVMMFYGRLAGMDTAAIRERTSVLLSQVGLEGRGADLVSSFSRGLMQRLGIAQALVSSPELLILDEPASGLDPVGQRDIRNLILAQRELGITVLLSSHQLSEVEAVCDEVTILDSGRVAQRGAIDTLLNITGQNSVTARSSADQLPEKIASIVGDVVVGSGTWVFSIPAHDSRRVVDVLDDDQEWELVSIQPKRESLEDYFSHLVSARAEGQVSR
ncbi:MAG: ABC transporter ATP-binding protein [Coriobacteriia bacterium]|nr:ABC transporter ATP-binding protein [Coriobacteriia bacterium]